MCAVVLYSFPPHLGSYTRALLVSQERRHRFVTPWWEWTLCTVTVHSTSHRSEKMLLTGSRVENRTLQLASAAVNCQISWLKTLSEIKSSARCFEYLIQTLYWCIEFENSWLADGCITELVMSTISLSALRKIIYFQTFQTLELIPCGFTTSRIKPVVDLRMRNH